MKSEKEIDAEIGKLEEMKPKVRHYTAFGDDNWAAVEVQIEALEKRMTDDACFDRWPNDASVEERNAAREASEWLYDETGEVEAPSTEWEPLTKPTLPMSKSHPHTFGEITTSRAVPGPKPRVVKPPRHARPVKLPKRKTPAPKAKGN